MLILAQSKRSQQRVSQIHRLQVTSQTKGRRTQAQVSKMRGAKCRDSEAGMLETKSKPYLQSWYLEKQNEGNKRESEK